MIMEIVQQLERGQLQGLLALHLKEVPMMVTKGEMKIMKEDLMVVKEDHTNQPDRLDHHQDQMVDNDDLFV